MPNNCPKLLTRGTCDDAGCRFNHNINVCEPCGYIAPSLAVYNSHIAGRKHRIRVAGNNSIFFCNICTKNVPSGGWDSHTSGRWHRMTAERNQMDGTTEPEEAIAGDGQRCCELCNIIINVDYWNRHEKSAKHRNREVFSAFRALMDDAEKDKHGVEVEDALDFGIVEPQIATGGIQLSVAITTSAPFAKIALLEIKLAGNQGRPSVTSSFSTVEEITAGTIITPTRPMRAKFSFKKSHIGRYEDRVEFIFEDTQLKKKFIISRKVKAIVGNKHDHDLLKPKSPYIPRKRNPRQPERDVVDGIVPLSLNAIPYVGKLPSGMIPGALTSALSASGGMAEKVSRIRRIFLPHSLDSETYGRHFKYLLWIEEFKMESDVERYDIQNAKLSRHLPYYYLDVPGLAEKRPSVLVGDRILVQKHDATQGHWYAGGVHVVRQAEVGLRFANSFGGWSDGQRYHVRFKLNRIPLQRQHQAMDTVFTQERVLFPGEPHISNGTHHGSGTMKLYNRLISSNPPQLQAVLSIVNQPPGALPFIVFGPPGTGKTITIVEAILQVLKLNPNSRILACAPSNSAADLIALRLKDGSLTEDTMFRFYAPSRFKNQVPDGLVPYTYTQRDGHFSVPPMARMKQFRVIITTCVSASVVAGIGIPRGHYSHIFIDEAGQSTEPEAFVSIKTIADNHTNIILSGDPKQLGPIIRSSIARELGLEKSYLERLMERDIYNVQNWCERRTVVKLVKNFRSHHAILDFPNQRFYDGDLEPCANPSVINSYLGSPYLPSTKFPVVFHAVTGKDDREASSPSFFNIDEVIQVKSYVERLRADRKFRITDGEIGIIAPYHAQCIKIRTALRAVADGVKVGSVEEFQGQERRVIIISTVRSSREFVEYDLRHTLGFVANPRRFNVAVTRAQALLIVVGDPQVLSLDPLWRSFLNYIHLNNGWTGPPITWDPHAPVDAAGGYDKAIREAAQLDMNEFSRRMEDLTMAEVGDDDDDANVDKPWREVE